MLRYAITDPSYYSSDPLFFSRFLERILRFHAIDMVVLRDKQTSDYETLARSFLSLKPHFPETKFLLHSDECLAASLGADGIHLPSNAFGRISHAKSLGLWTIVSTHTLDEAVEAEQEGADAVTFSPIFPTPGKGEPKGLEKLKEIKDKISIKLFALGGIVTDEQIGAVEGAGADGFASIRYFVE
ncbi:thiamine phosphate synthase [Hydrogenimonas cancrithermarum]|uniref:Thiamine-phosphate synthase 2 n=1 Tax=Hydrogenimonas cancrithermarum TaxID=2993563 RepID=A0ABM8FKY8_9BACT|nr:thiamine phosphate synthase [Hydrogenimonas cancrithermarum]BDY12080.1 putative thiamine-phosphate synthase 2 [Hydrogenimonas cancrithermarum]